MKGTSLKKGEGPLVTWKTHASKDGQGGKDDSSNEPNLKQDFLAGCAVDSLAQSP